MSAAAGESSSPISHPTDGRRGSHYRKLEDVPTRIHILGTGGVGKFVAHAIRGIADPPPVSLIFHRPTYYRDFIELDKTISITTHNNTEDRGGFDAELMRPKSSPGSSPQYQSQKYEQAVASSAREPISNLIVSVKAHQTISALSAVAERLTPDSTILFLQNGMGTIEEVNERIFTEPSNRPNYMLGINSHGIYTTGLAAATHAGHGTIMLGLLPRSSSSSTGEGEVVDYGLPDAQTARYLLRTLTRIPVLGAVGVSVPDLLQAQLEKLAVNCLVNPLTVMLDCHNGDLLNNFAISRTMYLLLAEISLVIRSLPELQGIPNVPLRFSPERLETTVIGVAEKTAANISSMLQDVRRGMQTEIEYINGYIVKRGEALGIKPVMNYMLMQLVLGKQQMISKEVDNYTPFTPKQS